MSGPRESRIRLQTSVMHSILSYGSATWASVLSYDLRGAGKLANAGSLSAMRVRNGPCLVRFRREDGSHRPNGTRKVVRSVNTDDFPAGTSATGAPPPPGPLDASGPERDRSPTDIATLEGEQEAWTRRMTFHLVQLMTGLGCFNWFLRRIGRATSVGCATMLTMRRRITRFTRSCVWAQQESFRPDYRVELVPLMLDKHRHTW